MQANLLTKQANSGKIIQKMQLVLSDPSRLHSPVCQSPCDSRTNKVAHMLQLFMGKESVNSLYERTKIMLKWIKTRVQSF